jgi:D-alanine-D-alanine ligase
MIPGNCCIIYNQPGEDALADELDVLDQVEFIGRTLERMGIRTSSKGITTDFMNEIAELSLEKPDFVFNLVESIGNKGELCYFIPALLNMHSIPYSGNPLEAMFITTNKGLTHKVLVKEGINTPGTFTPSMHKLLTPGKKYIIKPVWEDGSMGITTDSVFTFDPAGSNRLEDLDDRHWIVQEYIEGREFNISILYGKKNPRIMPPAEMIFRNFGSERPRIVDFKAKWETDSFEYKNTVREFPGDKLNPDLSSEINKTAIDCWNVFGLKGYARLDLRIDENDIPYVIEVNANPCLSPDSGLVAATSEAGLSFSEVLECIISDLNY